MMRDGCVQKQFSLSELLELINPLADQLNVLSVTLPKHHVINEILFTSSLRPFCPLECEAQVRDILGFQSESQASQSRQEAKVTCDKAAVYLGRIAISHWGNYSLPAWHR
jgi:hypothetical protein